MSNFFSNHACAVSRIYFLVNKKIPTLPLLVAMKFLYNIILGKLCLNAFCDGGLNIMEEKYYALLNYGCQMNESDTEHYAGQLEELDTRLLLIFIMQMLLS